MAVFPRREGDIRTLAQRIITGLTENAAIFTAPPVTAVALQAVLDSFITLDTEAVTAKGVAEQASQTKAAGLEELIEAMKAVLHYAEDKVARDSAKLALLGWGAMAEGTPLAVPGQPRTLEAPAQGEGWLFLDWKEALDGGAPASYKVERRERPAGAWSLVGVSINSEITLNNQERGKDWEFRVVAVNKTGDSAPSNMVAAVV